MYKRNIKCCFLFFCASFILHTNPPGLHHLTFFYIRGLSSKCAQPLREDLPADTCDLYLSLCIVGEINDCLYSATMKHQLSYDSLNRSQLNVTK